MERVESPQNHWEPGARGAVTTIEKDISMTEAAKRLGYGKRRMLAILRAGLVPTAYQSERGRWYIQPSGLEQYTRERAQR